MTDIKADTFQAALFNIERRAERQLQDELLVRCFVPNKVLDELDNNSNQLVFGRRGVGKTHTLKVLLSQIVTRGTLCHYLDCTTFGSGLGGEGSHRNTAIRFFSQLSETLTNRLLDDAIARESPVKRQDEVILKALSEISEACVCQVNGSFNYVRINEYFNQFLDLINAPRVTILLDEWAQIPLAAQPFFAEFIKRAFFSNPRITFKVAVVDYTYRFSEMVNGNMIGLEKSADIFSDVHMDKFFVWDHDHEFVEHFFAEVVFNHLAIELRELEAIGSRSRADWVITTLFTQRPVFAELCRAAEGNCRDLLILLGKAYKSFRRAGNRERIGLEDVKTAASELYKNDKYSNIASEGHLEEFLNYLVTHVIREKRSRTFMVAFEKRMHPLLMRLYSARLLHLQDIEWSHPDRPGQRYSLVTMDYGTYVTFKGTKNEPLLPLFFEPDDPKREELDLVPLDDRRSIRRIVLSSDILEKFTPK